MQESSSIEVLVIDLIDTLVHRGEHTFCEKACEYLQIKGIYLPVDLLFKSFRKRYLEYSLGNYQCDEEFFLFVLAGVGIANNDQISTKLRRMILECHTPFEDALPFLKWAHGRFRLIMASNMVAEWVEDILQRCSFYSYFDEFLVSSECRYRKPSSRFYQRLLDMAKVDSTDQLVMIGDSLINDGIGARRMGISSILVDREETIPKENLGEIKVVRSLAEIPNVLPTARS